MEKASTLIVVVLLVSCLVMVCALRLYFLRSAQQMVEVVPSLPFRSVQRIPLGPFQSGKHTHYVYNPSLFLQKDGRVLCAARIQSQSVLSGLSFASSYCQKPTTTHDRVQALGGDWVSHSAILVFHLDNPHDFRVINLLENDAVCAWGRDPRLSWFQGTEDPRLFWFRDRVWVYAHHRQCQHTPVLFPLHNPSHRVRLHTAHMQAVEKNWMPFVHRGELYFEYSISPHIILHCDAESGYCREAHRTDASPGLRHAKLGGGTPPQPIRIGGEDFYLGVGHTRRMILHRGVRKNFFYVFRAAPPFDIVRIGQEFSIFPDRLIEFVVGVVVRGDRVLLSMGVEDCEGWLVGLDLATVLHTLRPSTDQEAWPS